jgi:Na+/H+-dicarboxylate symporter
VAGLLLGLWAKSRGEPAEGQANWLTLTTIGTSYVSLLKAAVAPLAAARA